MQITLELRQAMSLAHGRYDGDSDVLTVSRSAVENTASEVWWRSDRGGRGDRGWRGRRDAAALATYRDLAQHAVEPLPHDEFPVEFAFRDGWGRPDKDIIKQGLRHNYLTPVLEDDRLIRFRVTTTGLALLTTLGLNERT